MAGRPSTKKTEEELVKTDSVAETENLLKEIEALKKELAKKEEEKQVVVEKQKPSKNKIPDDTEIEIESGLDSSLSFFDEKGRIFYTAEFDGLGNTDVISFADLKKMRSTSGKSKYLTRGFLIVKGDADGEFDFDQIIKELRLTNYYTGKLHLGNMEEVMLKGKAKDFIDGINEIKEKKSEMLYVMVDRFKHLYDKGLIKDVDKVNHMKYIVKKENGSVDLFD